MNVRDWNSYAKSVLKAEMARRQVNAPELVQKLEELGIEDNARNVANKIARGSFSAAFLFQCLAAMEVKNLHLGED
ncbi:hypothetical protein AAW01_12675 [Aurantiacibacter gangjinensis]|uniref:DUF6471 domain-containing protein n=1 Tax=Aurantiacibacter gangjinensis TaxID=502682 RepID=A0A0G9MKJ3_9SPHN|nr:hypothetical protein AAW01_12675 [Aurantiacibacter gangjinensis]